jgi:hypothetical protein
MDNAGRDPIAATTGGDELSALIEIGNAFSGAQGRLPRALPAVGAFHA